MRRARTLVTAIFTLAAVNAAAQMAPLRKLPGGNPAQQFARRPSQAHTASGLGSNPFLLIDFPGQMAQQAPFAINDSGKVVGFYNLPNNLANGYALAGKSFKDVIYPGAPATIAYSINRFNAVVGSYCDSQACDNFHGFLVKGGAYTSFDYPGGSNTSANGINAGGTIVGSYQSSDSVGHGFVLHNGVYASFDAPGADHVTWPSAINKQGTIVGLYQDNSGTNHAFILQNGVFTNADYPGAIDTELSGINDAGEMVGSFSIDGEIWHAFLLSAGAYTVFDAPFPGTTQTSASGINNRHQIVGSYSSSNNGVFYDFGYLTTY